MNPALLFTILSVSILMALLPRVTRPDLYFGATVEPAFRRTPEGRSIERTYWMWIAASAVLGIVLISLAPAFATLPPIIGSVAGWILGNRRTRVHARLPDPVREASLAPRRVPRALLAAAFVPLLLLGAAGLYLRNNWERIPDRFPVHFGLNGPDRWADKSPETVYGTLGIGAGICVSILLGIWLIARSRRIAVTGPAGERDTRYRNVNLSFLVATAWMIALMFGGISIATTTAPSLMSGPWMIALALAPVIGIVVAMIWISRYSAAAESEPVIGDRTPDQNWIWGGAFYWNRDDPSLVVEKRFGFGYTLNMAHVESWLILVVLLVPAVISMLLSHR